MPPETMALSNTLIKIQLLNQAQAKQNNLVSWAAKNSLTSPTKAKMEKLQNNGLVLLIF